MGLADDIRTTYGQAAKEARKKLDDFFAAYRQKAEQKLKQLKEGVISDEEYRRWMQSQMLTGKRWQEKLDDITKTYVDADKTARELVGDRSKNVFARFANSAARDIQNRFNGGVSFDMYDRHAVERLLTQNPRMLPEWKINEAKDYRWNAKRVQNAVVQGIIQGESIPQLTKRLTSELSAANAKHMTLFARTAMTGAQNAGRMERLHEAQDMGIVVKKKWLAAHDDRVRDAHAELDGQEVGIDEPFHSSLGDIMYPGDPAADPANIYNCRCTLTYVYDVKKSAENLKGQEEAEQENVKAYGYHPLTSFDYDAKIVVDVPEDIRKAIDSAGKKATDDFPVLDDYVRLVAFGDVGEGNPATFISHYENGNVGMMIALNRRMWSNMDGITEFVKKESKTGGHIKSSDARSIIAHEYGHAIHECYILRLAGYSGKGKIDPTTAMKIAGISDMIEYDIEKIVSVTKDVFTSARAQVDIKEYIAEAFSDYYYGERHLVSKKIIEYFKERFK